MSLAVAKPRNDRIGLRGYLFFRGSSTVRDWVTVPDDCSLVTGGIWFVKLTKCELYRKINLKKPFSF